MLSLNSRLVLFTVNLIDMSTLVSSVCHVCCSLFHSLLLCLLSLAIDFSQTSVNNARCVLSISMSVCLSFCLSLCLCQSVCSMSVPFLTLEIKCLESPQLTERLSVTLITCGSVLTSRCQGHKTTECSEKKCTTTVVVSVILGEIIENTFECCR